MSINKENKEGVIEFYNEATEDYLFWSKDYNMHFGYYEPLRNNPFKRDSMLNEMNHQVYKRLELKHHECIIADLGCGMGATMKYGLKKHSNLSAVGVTLSTFQVSKGNILLSGLNGKIINENYNNTSFATNFFDGAVALESFCHSGHSYKTLQEAHRILKPNCTLVIADAFLKQSEKKLLLSGKYCYEKLCDGWNLEGLADIKTFEQMLKEIGFKNIRIENISFKVAPSVLHVPFAISGFMIKKKLKNEPIKKQSINNLKGSFYALLSGLHLTVFGYYMITCEKI
jgi:cyclopropane fatty-acyl-phospholipid synthase-like methyltransferase